MEVNHPIGIDLGTTNTCAAVYLDGKVHIITNDEGETVTPSYVSFNDKGYVVGREARENTIVYPENTVNNVKRLMGRSYNDPDIQAFMKRLPYKVKEENLKPVIEVSYKGDLKTLIPEQISSMLLMKMKKNAEEYIGSRVKEAVITVPAHFNNAQRKATITAGELAGLKVLRLLVEPTAAAVAYTDQHSNRSGKNVLVFDLGGGTFDVSIIRLEGEDIKVLSVDGDSTLGGEDFDNRMAEYFAYLFRDHHKMDPYSDAKAIRRLKLICEDKKKVLSQANNAKIEVANFLNDTDLKSAISREKFNEINFDYFAATFKTVELALTNAHLTKEDIEDVVLVGGSTRIPKIQQLLADYFGEDKLKRSLNPEEAVAHGAAIIAAQSSGKMKNKKLKICDVTPLSIGVDIEGGLMSCILKRNTPIPATATRTYFNSITNQPYLDVCIYEGERPLVKDNNLLGSVVLENITQGPRYTVSFEYTFEVDVNGIMSVFVAEKGSGKGNHIKLEYNGSKLSPERVRDLINQAKSLKDEDEDEVKRVRSRTDLQIYCNEMKVKVANDPTKMHLAKVCDEMLSWTRSNPDATRQDYETKLLNLETNYGPSPKTF